MSPADQIADVLKARGLPVSGAAMLDAGAAVGIAFEVAPGAYRGVRRPLAEATPEVFEALYRDLAADHRPKAATP